MPIVVVYKFIAQIAKGRLELCEKDKSKTAYDVYLEYQPNSDGSRPSIGLGGVGSDYAPFQHTLGVPIIDVGFIQKNRTIPIYSTYHTVKGLLYNLSVFSTQFLVRTFYL